MKIRVKVCPDSFQSKVEKIADQAYKAWVKSPAKEGKANQELIEILARYFKAAKSQVIIKAGKRAKTKLVIISG